LFDGHLAVKSKRTPEPASNGSFWTTIPGLLTAAAGVISAVTGLVIALNQAGVLDFRKPPAIEAAAVSGAWRAQVTYSWGATHAERFAFQVDKDRLTGSVTYVGSPHGIESGKVEGNQITFTVPAEELIASEVRPYQLSYRGTVVGGGIHFELEDSRGTPAVQFAATRALPPP
jgi:hypothetical protein